MSDKIALKREFGLVSACALMLGNIIGAGIFLSPGVVLANVGNFWACLGVWLLTGFIALTGGLCYLELAMLIPKSGGPYHYLTKGLGNLVGYEYMWINLVFTRPASIAVAAISFGTYISPDLDKEIGVILILVCSVLVYFSTVWVKRVIEVCSFIKFAALVVIVITGIIVFCTNGFEFKSGVNYKSRQESSVISSWTTALFSAFWTYDGWDTLSYVTGEVKNPEKTFPKATWISLSLIVFLYFLVNMSYNVVLAPVVIAESDQLVAEFGQAVLGNFGRYFMSAIVIFSTFGSSLSSIFVTSRLVHAATVKEKPSQKTLWKAFSYLNVDY